MLDCNMNITFTSSRRATAIGPVPVRIGNMCGRPLARLRATVRPYQPLRIGQFPTQSPEIRSPKVVVPANQAQNPSRGCMGLKRRRPKQAQRHGSSREGMCLQVLFEAHTWHKIAAAPLNESPTPKNFERVVHVVDPASYSGHIDGSPTKMKLHLLPCRCTRLLRAASRAAASRSSASSPRSTGSTRPAHRTAARAAPLSPGGYSHRERRRRAVDGVLATHSRRLRPPNSMVPKPGGKATV